MISVIIPTFNRASFLKEAVQSVLDQDYFSSTGTSKPEFELIIVDDGSTDDTAGIARSFEGTCRLVYTYQENRGVSAARNRGLELASGDFIAFLDSDDLWLPEKIGLQMNFFTALPSSRINYTEEIWIRRGVRVNPRSRHRKYSGRIFDKVLPLCLISLSSAMYRKEVFEEAGTFDESLPACEDFDLGIRVAYRYPVYLLTKPLIVKRGGHPDQLSRKYWGLDRFRVAALEKALDLDLSDEQLRLVCREIIVKSRVLIQGYEKRGKTGEAGLYREKLEKYEAMNFG